MENYPKISVIIPVYNVEKYIKNCLDSLINQTFDNFEIILIDDASNDNSLKMIKEYQKKDSRVIVFEQKENFGAAIARNKGIELARGKYIQFLE